MAKVTVSFTLPDEDEASAAVMAIENSLPENAEDFEWDVE